jgi:hypothetical protein
VFSPTSHPRFPNVDAESGHPVAYQRVLAAASAYEIPPVFLKEDCERIVNDPKMADTVPRWMCVAERIATGSRARVIEDGPDTVHSDDEAKAEVIPDEEHGMSTAEMDPNLGPIKIPQHEVARPRAAAQALKAQLSCSQSASSVTDSEFGNSIVSSRVPSPEPSRQPTPLSSPSNSDDEGMTEYQRRHAASAKKKASRAQPPRCLSAPGTKAPKKSVPKDAGEPVTRLGDVADPASSETSKVAAPNERLQRKDRIVPGQRSPHMIPIRWPHEDKMRAGLEACDQGAVQGKRIRVLHKATLPKPES